MYMYLPAEDLKEVRIFRSRVIRITEHRVECPIHLREEIASIISETVSVRSGKKTIFEVERDILPMVTYLSHSKMEIEKETFVGKKSFANEELELLIKLLE